MYQAISYRIDSSKASALKEALNKTAGNPEKWKILKSEAEIKNRQKFLELIKSKK